MGALGRTARRLSAGLAALFLIALCAALAPQDARAQVPTLTATAGDGQVTLNWTYTGSGLTGWGYKINGGVHTWAGTPIAIPASNSGTRSHTVTGLTNGTPYQFIVYAQTDANTAFRQSNQVSATPQVPAPTLISGPDSTIRTAETTTQVCYNLLSVSQGATTYLEARQGKTAVTAHSVLSDTSLGVEITQAPAGITKGRAVNLSPCVSLGKGAHTVTWSWRGQDGTATAGTTSTTVTITGPAPAAPVLTLTAGANALALRWDKIEGVTGYEYQYKVGTGSFRDWIAVPVFHHFSPYRDFKQRARRLPLHRQAPRREQQRQGRGRAENGDADRQPGSGPDRHGGQWAGDIDLDLRDDEFQLGVPAEERHGKLRLVAGHFRRERGPSPYGDRPDQQHRVHLPGHTQGTLLILPEQQRQ